MTDLGVLAEHAVLEVHLLPTAVVELTRVVDDTVDPGLEGGARVHHLLKALAGGLEEGRGLVDATEAGRLELAAHVESGVNILEVRELEERLHAGHEVGERNTHLEEGFALNFFPTRNGYSGGGEVRHGIILGSDIEPLVIAPVRKELAVPQKAIGLGQTGRLVELLALLVSFITGEREISNHRHGSNNTYFGCLSKSLDHVLHSAQQSFYSTGTGLCFS